MADTDEIKTADVVLLGTRDGQEYVLLIQRDWPPYEGAWALPGGHVDPEDEDEEVAGRRELAEETGIDADGWVLELIGTYAQPGRDPRGAYKTWAWLARIDHLPQPVAGTDARAARWWPVAEALAQRDLLAFDHHRILTDGVARARTSPSTPLTA